MNIPKPVHLGLASLLVAAQVLAQALPADKSQFSLFNPRPPSQMREFNADRPGVTESPYTVDAGHMQVELSFVEYTHDSEAGIQTDGYSVLPANLKIGLLNNLDLQLILNSYENFLIHGKGTSQRDDGFGDTEIRAKLNLWGNDGGNTAFCIMPFVRLPTGVDHLSDHHVEGGLDLPLTVRQLPGGFDLSTMAEFDVDHNDANDNYGIDFVHTLNLQHELGAKKLSGYLEYAGVAPIDTDQTYLAYVDTGVTYLVSKNVQLDAGINIGISRRAEDFTVFAGLSVRF
jgi:Putative MetA-pathway of phenol degradation